MNYCLENSSFEKYSVILMLVQKQVQKYLLFYRFHLSYYTGFFFILTDLRCCMADVKVVGGRKLMKNITHAFRYMLEII